MYRLCLVSLSQDCDDGQCQKIVKTSSLFGVQIGSEVYYYFRGRDDSSELLISEFWAGTTMMAHPRNFRHPSPFRRLLREKYSLAARANPARRPDHHRAGRKPLELNYRNMIYDGQSRPRTHRRVV